MQKNTSKFRALALGCALATLGGGAVLYAAPASAAQTIMTRTAADTVPSDTTRPKPDTTMPVPPPPPPDTTRPHPDTTHQTPMLAIKPL